MNKSILEYLNNHAIIIISLNYADIIVDNPIHFIRFLATTNYYISEILWWERIKVLSQRNSLGYGGPLDPRNNDYFFSETDLYCSFDPSTESDALVSYIHNVRIDYPQHELFPSFTIKKIDLLLQ